jgi:hypothetical protein
VNTVYRQPEHETLCGHARLKYVKTYSCTNQLLYTQFSTC